MCRSGSQWHSCYDAHATRKISVTVLHSTVPTRLHRSECYTVRTRLRLRYGDGFLKTDTGKQVPQYSGEIQKAAKK